QHGDVDPTSHHWCGPLFRNPAARLVAAGSSDRTGALRNRQLVFRHDHRPDHSVRVYVGAHSPRARRHPAPDLGYRPWLRSEVGRYPVLEHHHRLRDADGSDLGRGHFPGRRGVTMAMRTPLKNVRRLGSAKEGTDHFWRQRVTSVAALLLLPFMLWFALALVGADYETVRQTLANPIVAILLISFIVTSAVHMRLGMQV